MRKEEEEEDSIMNTLQLNAPVCDVREVHSLTVVLIIHIYHTQEVTNLTKYLARVVTWHLITDVRLVFVLFKPLLWFLF